MPKFVAICTPIVSLCNKNNIINFDHCLDWDQNCYYSICLEIIVENLCKISGQTGAKQAILENPGVFLNPEQPLIAAVTITKDDVRRQEERVKRARVRLQEALAAAQGYAGDGEAAPGPVADQPEQDLPDSTTGMTSPDMSPKPMSADSNAECNE